MMRRSLRKRGKAAAMEVGRESAGNDAPARTSPASPDVVSADVVCPRRGPDGFALQYMSYFSARATESAPDLTGRPPRRERFKPGMEDGDANLILRSNPRLNPNGGFAAAGGSYDIRATADTFSSLNIDPASMQRLRDRSVGGEAVPDHGLMDAARKPVVENIVRDLIAEVAQLTASASRMDDICTLKAEVAARSRTTNKLVEEVKLIRTKVFHAEIIGGLRDVPSPSKSAPAFSTVQKVPGSPRKPFGTRTISGLREKRRAAAQATTRNQIRAQAQAQAQADAAASILIEAAPPSAAPALPRSGHGNRMPSPPGPQPRSPSTQEASQRSFTNDPARLTRKSSSGLRRLGNAGSRLVRRISRVSSADGFELGAPGECPLDAELLERLNINPLETVQELKIEERRLLEQQNHALEAQVEVQTKLDNRRGIHNRLMDILDQFYGGTRDDMVSAYMDHETQEMTEAGLEAEKDLTREMRFRHKAYIAFNDHTRAQKALREGIKLLEEIIEQLGRAKIASKVDLIRGGEAAANAAVEAHDRMKIAKIRSREACRKAKIASYCCRDLPRISPVEVTFTHLLTVMDIRFDSVGIDMMTLRTISEALGSSRKSLEDCRLAKTFAENRVALITEDIMRLDDKVERCEEYVLQERLSILHQHHPAT